MTHKMVLAGELGAAFLGTMFTVEVGGERRCFGALLQMPPKWFGSGEETAMSPSKKQLPQGRLVCI
jgi:hypothetical protein